MKNPQIWGRSPEFQRKKSEELKGLTIVDIQTEQKLNQNYVKKEARQLTNDIAGRVPITSHGSEIVIQESKKKKMKLNKDPQE